MLAATASLWSQSAMIRAEPSLRRTMTGPSKRSSRASGIWPGLVVHNAGGHGVAMVTVSDDQGGAIIAANDDRSEQAQLKVKRDLAGAGSPQCWRPRRRYGHSQR